MCLANSTFPLQPKYFIPTHLNTYFVSSVQSFSGILLGPINKKITTTSMEAYTRFTPMRVYGIP